MTKYADAALLSVGDRFQLHHDGKYHRIAALIPSDDGTMTVVFDDPANSRYVFRVWGERVVFPRRDDGSTIDWRTREQAPFPYQVYPGDRLPNALFPDLPPELVEPQIVVACHESPREFFSGDFRIYDVTTVVKGETGAKRYRFAEFEKLTWPREPVQRKRTPRVDKDGGILWHGPYTHPNSPEASFYFAEHPTGRGRWPRGIEPYEHNRTYEPGEHRLRFPRNDWDPALVPSSADLPTGRVQRGSRTPDGALRWL